MQQARIVYDKFHVSKELNDAVDLIRRKEHQQLLYRGDQRLAGTRPWWLMRPERLSDACRGQFDRLVRTQLKAARAWIAKQLFDSFWQSPDLAAAQEFFALWYGRIIRSRIPQLKAVAKMLRSHLERLLNSFLHPITNAVTEGFNSKIQALRHAARGFRSFCQLSSAHPVLLRKTLHAALNLSCLNEEPAK